MSWLGARAILFCVPVILGGLPLAAQSSSYHLEFDDRTPSRAALVNDSAKSIEAFVALQRCQKPGSYSGFDNSRDILDIPRGVGSEILAADGHPARSGVLETGGRWQTNLAIFPENGDCRNHVSGVLFSDGSFEGEDAGVRGLKAWRDGLAAAVHHWADRINQEKPDGSTLEALHDELKRRKSEDQMKLRKYKSDIRIDDPPQLLWQYWSGWLAVETNLEFRLSKDLSEGKADENFRKLADEINHWKMKIDGNLALQKLNIVFPAISEPEDKQ